MQNKSLLYVFFSIFLLCSCGKKEEVHENILLKFGDNILTYDEVVEQIPAGLTTADSSAMFSSIVNSWMTDVVLSDFAEARLMDLNAIEHRVNAYRNNLIVLEYLSRMRETKNPEINENEVKEYFDKHRKELKLEVPLVKGVFLKINSNVKGQESIKKLMLSDDSDKIDELEQEWIDKAIEYNYFRDKWIDWETLTSHLPYRFGTPDDFLKENSYFETEYEDCKYYLRITDYLPTGEEQPYEYASTWITELMTQGELLDYEHSIVESLLRKAIKENRLETPGYDPFKQILLKKFD